THRELRAGFTDRLGGDDADGFTDLHRLAGGEVETVALGAATALGFAGEHGADLQLLVADALDRLGRVLVHELVVIERDLTRHRVLDLFARGAAVDAEREGGSLFVAVIDRRDDDTAGSAAVLDGDDDVLRH